MTFLALKSISPAMMQAQPLDSKVLLPFLTIYPVTAPVGLALDLALMEHCTSVNSYPITIKMQAVLLHDIFEGFIMRSHGSADLCKHH